MKISYRTHPILEKLNKGSLGTIPILKGDKEQFEYIDSLFTETWKHYAPKFKKNIYLLSKTYVEAAQQASKPLSELYTHIITENLTDFSISATFVIKDDVFMAYLDTHANSEDIDTCIYIFNRLGIPVGFYCKHYFEDKTRTSDNIEFGWASTYYRETEDREGAIKAIENIKAQMGTAIVVDMFRRYASVETKVFGPNTVTKHAQDKYVNDTRLPLTYLDSKWFTTLVKSAGFDVRGHFRLQPKIKDGKWTRELIWINTFRKTGYTAPARKLKTINLTHNEKDVYCSIK